jgi:hypothetical protein
MKLFVVALMVMVSSTARADDPPALDVAVKQAAAAGKPRCSAESDPLAANRRLATRPLGGTGRPDSQ